MSNNTPCPKQAYCELRDQTDMRYISQLTRNSFAIILAGGRGSRLKQLTDFREHKRTNDAGTMSSVSGTLKDADIVMILLPDENHPEVYNQSVHANMKKGAALMLAPRVFITTEIRYDGPVRFVPDGRTQLPDGRVVAQRAVNAGDIVSPGTLLLVVVDPSSMRLEAPSERSRRTPPKNGRKKPSIIPVEKPSA